MGRASEELGGGKSIVAAPVPAFYGGACASLLHKIIINL
jgi:hypothetical protein